MVGHHMLYGEISFSSLVTPKSAGVPPSGGEGGKYSIETVEETPGLPSVWLVTSQMLIPVEAATRA